MKVTCKTAEQTFQPVTISITCESPEELFALWHRFNVSEYRISMSSDEKEFRVPNGKDTSHRVWYAIDNQVQKLLK